MVFFNTDTNRWFVGSYPILEDYMNAFWNTVSQINEAELVSNNPENHQYYFFVADVSNPGYHLFAKTMAQHNANRKQYINWINKQGINR